MTRYSLTLFYGLLAVSLWAACGKSSVSGPSAASADPAVEVEQRLWTDATVAQAEGRQNDAVRSFRRFLSVYPQSPRTAEAHWRLGQALEQMGDVPAAVTEYQALLDSEPALRPVAHPFHLRATERLNELRRAGIAVRETMAGHTALSLSPAGILELPHFDRWLADVRAAGVTVLALDVGCDVTCAERMPGTQSGDAPPVDRRSGVLFSTTHAPVVRPLLDEVVPQAHRAGLSVIGIIDVRRAPWLAGQGEWQASVFDPRDRTVRPWLTVDLLNPSVHTHIGALLSDLVRTDIDGVLIRTRHRNSFAYEVGETALASFSAHYRETPADIMSALATSSSPARHIESSTGPADERDRQQAAGTLWHWVGWKTRQELDVLEQLRRTIQQQRHGLRVIIEVHPEALSEPLSALVNYGEDAVEAGRRGFDIMVNGPARAGDAERLSTFLKNLEHKLSRKPVIGQPRRQHLWLLARVQGLTEWVEQGRLRQEADRLRLYEDVNLLLAPDIGPGVP